MTNAQTKRSIEALKKEEEGLKKASAERLVRITFECGQSSNMLIGTKIDIITASIFDFEYACQLETIIRLIDLIDAGYKIDSEKLCEIMFLLLDQMQRNKKQLQNILSVFLNEESK